MTHLQITAVHISAGSGVPPCCRGLIQHVRIGPGRQTQATAIEIKADLLGGRERYFAIVGGQYMDVVTGDCATCGAPYLTTDDGRDPLERLEAVAA